MKGSLGETHRGEISSIRSIVDEPSVDQGAYVESSRASRES